MHNPFVEVSEMEIEPILRRSYESDADFADATIGEVLRAARRAISGEMFSSSARAEFEAIATAVANIQSLSDISRSDVDEINAALYLCLLAEFRMLNAERDGADEEEITLAKGAYALSLGVVVARLAKVLNIKNNLLLRVAALLTLGRQR